MLESQEELFTQELECFFPNTDTISASSSYSKKHNQATSSPTSHNKIIDPQQHCELTTEYEYKLDLETYFCFAKQKYVCKGSTNLHSQKNLTKCC